MSTDTKAGDGTDAKSGSNRGKAIKNHRLNSIIISPAGVDDPNQRIHNGNVESLGEFLVTQVQKENIESLELLAFPTHETVVYVICVQPAYTNSDRLNKHGRTTLDKFNDGTPSVTDATVESVVTDLRSKISADWGIQTGTVDLGPVSRGSVIGTRFLVEKNRAMTDPDKTNVLLFEDLVDELRHSHKPFLLQTILRDAGKKYEYTGRLAVLHSDHSLVRIEDRVDHLRHGRQFDVEKCLSEVGLRSNHQLPIRDFVSPQHNDIKFGTRKYKEKSHSYRALELYEGISEFLDLLRGRRGSDSLYGDLDLFGVIPAHYIRTGHLGSLVPVYYQTSPWTSVHGRAPPRIDVDAIEHDPNDEADIGINVDTTVERTTSHTLDGDETHTALERFSLEVLQRDMPYVENVKQKSGEKNPDLLIQLLKALANGEVEHKNKSKGGKTVLNYAKARADDREVWFIVKNKESAETYLEILLQPWRKTRSDGALLYNSNRTVSIEKGLKPVLPEDVNQSRWVIHGTDLTLKTASKDILATGLATESIDTFDFDTPLYESGDRHRILDTDGRTLAEGPTKSSVLDDFTEVYVPVIPDDLYLIDGAKIFYPERDSLREFSIDPDWGHQGKKSDIYREGLRKFCERYMVTGDDASMPYSEFQTRVQQFFDDFAETTPGRTHIGRNLPPAIEVDDPGVRDREIHADLVFDPNLDSPI